MSEARRNKLIQRSSTSQKKCRSKQIRGAHLKTNKCKISSVQSESRDPEAKSCRKDRENPSKKPTAETPLYFWHVSGQAQ